MGFQIMVDGTGMIGLPFILALLKFRSQLDIDVIYFRKFDPNKIEHLGMLWRLEKAGARLVVEGEKYDSFVVMLEKLGSDKFSPYGTYEDALKCVDAVVDCTEDGIGRKNKKIYEANKNLLVAVAQGSETDFGFPYAYGHNDEELACFHDRFVWVMSCNVHSLLAVIHALTKGFDKKELENIEHIRFHLERRGADIANKKINVTPEIGIATDKLWGAHQARDTMELLKTKGIVQIDIHARANKTPQPFMHQFETRVFFKSSLTKSEVLARFQASMFMGITYYRDIGGIYTEGRDWGFAGRINLQSVLVVPSLEVLRGGREVVFECVTPQDGNPIASSLAALARYFKPDSWRKFMEKQYHPLFRRFKIV